jgi:hypothetical protein
MSATTSSIAAVVAAVATKTVGVLSVNVKLLKDTDENFDTNQRYSAFVAKYQDQLAELSKAIAKAGFGDIQLLAADLAEKSGEPALVIRSRHNKIVFKGGRGSLNG